LDQLRNATNLKEANQIQSELAEVSRLLAPGETPRFSPQRVFWQFCIGALAAGSPTALAADSSAAAISAVTAGALNVVGQIEVNPLRYIFNRGGFDLAKA
jgi:hypothetical protein